jgi:hypothetical protein
LIEATEGAEKDCAKIEGLSKATRGVDDEKLCEMRRAEAWIDAKRERGAERENLASIVVCEETPLIICFLPCHFKQLSKRNFHYHA